MRAKLISEATNFERGIDPKDAMSIGDTLARKFKLNSFRKKLFEITKKSLNSNDIYNIGTEIGDFIDTFYPYKYKESNDPEWGSLLLPTNPENQDQFHPRLIEIIDEWIKKEFPKWKKNDILDFWEGIADHIHYR